MTFWLLALVLLEPVKSAEPPTSSGKTGTSASSTLPEAWRVAILGASLAALAFTWASAARTSGGSSPFMRRENSARVLASAASSLFFQDAESLAPRPPASRQNFITSSGITKGGSCHPQRLRAPAISAAPRGEPCAAAVPALVGAPNAIVVLQAMREGRTLVRASEIAAATASVSWPSPAAAAQPAAEK